MKAPTVAEVDRIAAMTDPIDRNRFITQCYHDLSLEMTSRTGRCANWCTLATWASRQAGQTIRGQDLRDRLEQALGNDAYLLELLGSIVWWARQVGVQLPLDDLRRSVVGEWIAAASATASDAAGRGNQKVFVEIGREFARFMSTCFSDDVYHAQHLADFCESLRDGDPPNGQTYLKKAFTGYYRSFFETDAKRVAELRFLANIEIGFHEQTRLQPEIAEALNAGKVSPEALLKTVSRLLSARAGFLKRLLFSMQALAGRDGLLRTKVDELAARLSARMRQVLTEELMTLTIPPGQCLRLGTDLQMDYPALLVQFADAELKTFLARIDPTPDSVQESGAIDWSDLSERLHYITDLFRCCDDNAHLFDPVN